MDASKASCKGSPEGGWPAPDAVMSRCLHTAGAMCASLRSKCVFSHISHFHAQVNLVGVMRVTQAFLPLLRAGEKPGRIINMSSQV